MGRLRAKSDYEEIRKARISQNQARLASLGLQKTISELRSLSSSAKPERTLVRKHCKVDYRDTPLRRSARLSGCGKLPTSPGELDLLEGRDSVENSKERSSGNVSRGRPKRGRRLLMIAPEVLARRCESKGRGSLYNPVYGICCHFCRQKKMCGEEDCKHCGYLDMDEPCTGKTECSNCHSSNGILCRACLKVRYGEEMEEVRANKEWICPHCVEDKGINPFWICNRTIFGAGQGLLIRGSKPTYDFILPEEAKDGSNWDSHIQREMGFKSVAHLLMDKLARADKK